MPERLSLKSALIRGVAVVTIAPSAGVMLLIIGGVTSIVNIDEAAARLVARSRMMTETV